MSDAVRHELWYQWARIAIREAGTAEDCRARIGTTGDRADDGRALAAEIDAGLVAICAAAFSIEAIVQLIAPMALPPATVAAWKGKTTGFESRLRETLKHSVRLSGAQVEELVSSFKPTIVKRGAAVHYEGKYEEPVLHPVGGLSSQVTVDYGAESAREAVGAMRKIYGAILEYAKPSIDEFAKLSLIPLGILAGRITYAGDL